MSNAPPLVLVDGSSWLFRAFHALPPLTNAQGEPTGAIVGVAKMLLKLQQDYRPQRMVVVFDAPGPTFRHQIFADYKAHRPPMPEELRSQIEPLHRLVQAMGLPLLSVSGVEADDVLGTLAVQAQGQSHIIIATSDKDLAQLVNERVRLIDTMSNRILDPAGVVERFGVEPAQMVDFLALTGDTSDNIPGVPKCGPKTAAKWLAEYRDLDSLMARAGEIGGKIGEHLRGALAQLPLSRDLTRIRTDLVLGLAPDALDIKPMDQPRLRALYEWMGARQLLAQLDSTEPESQVAAGAQGRAPDRDRPPTAISQEHYETILTEAALEAWLERLHSAPLVALDTETSALNPMQARLVGLSFAVQPGTAAYLPLAHTAPGTPKQLDADWALSKLRPWLEDPSRPKLLQNLKYDMSILAQQGLTLRGVTQDTLLESYVLDSNLRPDLDSQAMRELQHKTIGFTDIAGKGSHQLSFDQIPLEQAAPYAAEDADICLRLHQVLWPRLEAEPRLKQLYQRLELPLAAVLSRMERTGVRIDAAMLKQQSQELAKSLLRLEQQAYELAGHPFNLASPKQLGELLFGELKLPTKAKTKGGAASTAEAVLEELTELHALPGVILEHRGLFKLKSTYCDKLPPMLDPTTGRIHTSYHQAVTATGRLSSSEPNLQNIPIRTPEGRRIRQAFVPEPSYLMLAADYSQIELRIMAHLSGDAGLLQAFAKGQDIHRATAAEVFAKGDLEAVTQEQRRSAKAINFGLIYGMSAFGLAKQLGITRGAAQDYVDLYFQRYPGVKVFMETTKTQAREQGFVETIMGRRLYLPDIQSRNPNQRAGAERTAINAPMQGSAADIIKAAMLAVDAWIQEQGDRVRLLMQVHDELVFEVRPEALDMAKAEIRRLMEGAALLRVPLVVDIGIGNNWDEAH
jgi:DNA polymerase-1